MTIAGVCVCVVLSPCVGFFGRICVCGEAGRSRIGQGAFFSLLCTGTSSSQCSSGLIHMEPVSCAQAGATRTHPSGRKLSLMLTILVRGLRWCVSVLVFLLFFWSSHLFLRRIWQDVAGSVASNTFFHVLACVRPAVLLLSLSVCVSLSLRVMLGVCFCVSVCFCPFFLRLCLRWCVWRQVIATNGSL